jgi:hypothetical protein
MNPAQFLRMGITVFVLIFSVMLTPLAALTIMMASAEELTGESDLVVVGKINSVEYVWEDETHRAINTLLTIEVEQYVKGTGNSTVVVRQLGGQIGDFGDEIPGTPLFDTGEEVVFFLVKHKGDYWIHSIALGAFRIIPAEGGQKVVINHLQDVTVLDPASREEINPEHVFKVTPLTEFIGEIETYVR